jgi:hypothetical protein
LSLHHQVDNNRWTRNNVCLFVHCLLFVYLVVYVTCIVLTLLVLY